MISTFLMFLAVVLLAVAAFIPYPAPAAPGIWNWRLGFCGLACWCLAELLAKFPGIGR
jgi:hypothetical protein